MTPLPQISGRRVWLPVDNQTGAVDWFAIESNLEDLAPRPWPWSWREFQLVEVPLSAVADRMLRGAAALPIPRPGKLADTSPALCAVCRRQHPPAIACDPFLP